VSLLYGRARFCCIAGCRAVLSLPFLSSHVDEKLYPSHYPLSVKLSLRDSGRENAHQAPLLFHHAGDGPLFLPSPPQDSRKAGRSL